ncbi:MAG: hypothetical protein ACPG4K_00775 [Haloferula sp.]
MDLFPDFNELEAWGYIVPTIVLFAVAASIWKILERASKLSIQHRIIQTIALSMAALVVLCIFLVIVGALIVRINNPSLR